MTRMQRAGIALVTVILLSAIANALLYTKCIADPVIRSDGWYFLDVFISKDLDGSLKWTDYFVKRDASDHSVPLQKWLLALNTERFGLDFLYEALVGFIGMVVCCFYLLATALGAVRRGPRLGEACLVGLIPLLFFSLSTAENYESSLVMLSYIVLPFGMLLFSCAYRPGSARRAAVIFFCTVVSLVVMDNAGVLVCLAAIVALMLETLRGGGWRSAVVRMLPIAAGIVLYRWMYWLLIPRFPAKASGGPNEALNFLIAHGNQAWKWAILPAAASVAYSYSYTGLLGYPFLVVAGLIVMALHAVFWVSVWRTPAGQHATFVAVCLMLLAYSATAGVVAVRVPEYGWDYLKQGRYVVFYQFANIALVLQWLSTRNSEFQSGSRRMEPRRGRVYHLRGLLPVATLAAVAVLQSALAVRAWHQSRYIREYHQGMAQTIFCLARHPDIEVPVCEPMVSACERPLEVRNRLIGLLKDHQLNVFSQDFQRRHAMQPNSDAEDRCLPPGPLVVTKVVDVQVTKDSEKGDQVVIGSLLGTGLREGDVVVINDNYTFGIFFGNQTWISFSIPLSVVSDQKSFTIYVIRPSTKERSRTFSINF